MGNRLSFKKRVALLIVGMFCFDLEFLLAGLADPMVFAVDKRVIVDAGAVILGAKIALHS